MPTTTAEPMYMTPKQRRAADTAINDAILHLQLCSERSDDGDVRGAREAFREAKLAFSAARVALFGPAK